MKLHFKRIISLDSFSDTIADNDMPGRQRFRLFKTATFISLLVYIGFFTQVMVVMPGNPFLILFMFALFVFAFLNYFLLAWHKKPKPAFTILLCTWFLLIHIDTYYSGGIRNSANFYFAVLILTAFILLGNKGGKTMAAFAVIHLIYFYIVTVKTDWITYDLVGTQPALIDLYFFLSTTISLVVLTIQSDYIEWSKNEIIQDIESGRHKLEMSEEILELKNKELERKNIELEEFAYLASHDLQEPLKTSSGFAQLLKRQYQGKLDENADQYLTFIVDSAVRMKTLIKDLLDYSKIGYQGKKVEIDCNVLMNELFADLNSLIRDTNAIIHYEHLPAIKGYATEIKLLFQNLLVNAIKFRKQDVQPEIRITSTVYENYWQFTITDNGIGIDKDHFDKIFVIFQRLHNQSDFKGSGIGLAHCKKIVELHNGKIWVESVSNIGSTFFFTINKN